MAPAPVKSADTKDRNPPMRARPARHLTALLRDARGAPAPTLSDWDALLPCARRHGLLGRLDHALRQAGVAVPAPVAPHLAAARFEAAERARMLRWEADCVRRALAGFDAPLVLLKGAAYELAGLPCAPGRLASDLDILVPKARLAEVEARLLAHGWEHAKTEAYDQRYYREWMHELPPLVHRLRGTAVDVHHTILPPSGRLSPDGARLLAEARPLPGTPFHVLAPTDLVLHSAAHAFEDGDLGRGLRDLADLHALLTHFAATEPRFAERLAERARTLGLERPLYYALRYCRRLFGTALAETLVAAAPAGRRLMDPLVEAALLGSRAAPLAAQLLYLRAHWLRMPPGLLARHLGRKALRRLRPA